MFVYELSGCGFGSRCSHSWHFYETSQWSKTITKICIQIGSGKAKNRQLLSTLSGIKMLRNLIFFFSRFYASAYIANQLQILRMPLYCKSTAHFTHASTLQINCTFFRYKSRPRRTSRVRYSCDKKSHKSNLHFRKYPRHDVSSLGINACIT